MVALWNRADHYIFILWFLSFYRSSSIFFSSPDLSGRTFDVYHTSTHGVAVVKFRMQVSNVLHAARWKWRTQKIAKIGHLVTIAQLCWVISSQLRHVSTIRKKLLSSNISTCPDNMVNFGPPSAEIDWRVWSTPSYFNGYRVLAALLHGTLVVGVRQTLRRWTESATYIRQGDHQVRHSPTFL